MAVKIQLRRGTEAEFDSANTSSTITPADGEVLVVQETGTTGGYLLIGNGSSNYLALKGDHDGRVYFKSGYSKTILGGAQATGDTPLTVKAASGQTAAIMRVTTNADADGNGVPEDAILEIFDNEGPIVRLESHGDVDDVLMRLRGQVSGTANILEVQTGESGNATQIAVDADGLVALTPTDNQSADDPTLDVRGSAGSQSNGILRVKKSDNDNVLLVNTDKVVVDGFPVVAQADGDATSNVTLVGTTDASAKAITVDDGGTENFSVTAGGAIATNGAVTSEGKGTFADAEIDVTGRTLTSALLLRLDEIIGITGPFTFTTDTPSDSNYNGTTEHLLPLDVASSSHDFASKTSFPNQPALTLVPISGTNASPDTSGEFGTGTGDTTNAHLLRIPANSGRMRLKITLTSGQGGISPVNLVGGEAKFYSYTAQTATSSDNKTQLGGVVADLVASGSIASVVGTVRVANSTVEKFVAVSFDADHDTGSSDPFSYTFEVSRDGETVVAL